MQARTSCWNCCLRLAAGLCLVAVAAGLAAYAGRTSLLTFVGAVCVREDAPSPGRAVLVLLIGEPETRVAEAVRLFRSGVAEAVVFARPEDGAPELDGLVKNESELLAVALERSGIPKSAIRVVGAPGRGVTSTVEEVRALAAHFADLEPRPERLMVVTSWYHTARAGRTFDAVFRARLPGMKIEMQPAYGQGVTRGGRWWLQERALVSVFSEYVKSGMYLWRYGI